MSLLLTQSGMMKRGGTPSWLLDVVNLDDTHCAHPYAKQLPFLSWLFDHSTKTYAWSMNLVVVQVVLKSGLKYPLFYSIWHKPATSGEGPSKLDLSKQMILMLRESTALFRKEIEPLTRRERYVPLTPVMLIPEVFKQLTRQAAFGLVSIAIPDIYMKQPYTVTNSKGKQVSKQRYVRIAAIVAMRLKDDEASSNIEQLDDESPATYKGACLIISNRHDAPKEALQTCVKRWRIEVLFRTAKQELAFEKCHSESEAHHHAHFELLFTAETLLAFALFEINKEKTSDDKGCTHGEMVRGLFHTRCQTRTKNHMGQERV
ncbi:transposase [Paenibacillus ferrarius]|uniref:transposase n=1 Tax=Paenibacillus ferrarius TaxID=1469647 RepID=UPI001180EDF6|nr:transposase [Paenibacillus ferrarius]